MQELDYWECSFWILKPCCLKEEVGTAHALSTLTTLCYSLDLTYDFVLLNQHNTTVVRGVGGVCGVCMCLARCGVGVEEGEWMRELGLGFTNPVGTGGVLDMGLCFGCGGVGGEWHRLFFSIVFQLLLIVCYVMDMHLPFFCMLLLYQFPTTLN